MTHIARNLSFWLDPEKGELGKLSENYLHSVPEAAKLIAAAGYQAPIPLPYHLSGEGAITDQNTLIIDSLNKSGVFTAVVHQYPSRDYSNNINVAQLYDGMAQQSGSIGNPQVDYSIFRDYYSKSRPDGQTFSDPKLDDICERTRTSLDFETRVGVLKEFQLHLAQEMYTVPARHNFTVFSFRWPWLRNSQYAANRGSSPNLGAHLHWLDSKMPNRSG